MLKDKLFMIILMAAAIFLTPLSVKGSSSYSRSVFPEKLNVLLTESGEVREVTAKEYITGCIAAQIPIDYEQEALNAQAAAAATYALRLMLDFGDNPDNAPENSDISDSPKLCQPFYTEEKCRELYGTDYARYKSSLEKAAEYGLSHIITCENQPIYAVYHSVSAGKTCSALPVWGRDFPYLQPAESAADTGYRNFLCTNELTAEKARLALTEYNPDIEVPADCGKWFTELNANEEGYVISVKIGANIFSGGDIWRIFGLRSTAFTVSYADGVFSFTTKGYGHGAGLSQYAANEMAKSGATADEILRHYYGDEVRF